MFLPRRLIGLSGGRGRRRHRGGQLLQGRRAFRNDITQNGQAGIRVFSAGNVGVVVDSNRVPGAGRALDITTPGVALTQFVSGLVGAVLR